MLGGSRAQVDNLCVTRVDVHVKSFRRRLVYFICRTTNDMYCTAAERLYPSTSTARGQATCDVHCAGSPQYDEWRQG
jgi:hypothetical protein